MVVSFPWNQATLAPFETEGLMNGGAVHGGIPWSSVYVGWMPLELLLKVWVRVNPELWVDPLTETREPKERE